jgi:hypothetical protein
LQNLFQFSLPEDSGQVTPATQHAPFRFSALLQALAQAQAAVCCGVPVDTGLPLLFFALNMCAPDTFLYLTVQ